MNAEQLCAAALQRHNSGDLAGAEGLCRAALEIDARYAEALHRLGRIAYARGQYERSVEMIEQAVRLKPRHAGYREALGLALRAAGRHREAVAAFRHAVRLEKTSATAFHHLGNGLAAVGEQAEAAQCFRRAVAIDARFAGAHNGLGNALATMGQFAQAAAAYRAAVALEPGAEQIRTNLAAVLLELGREAEAVEMLEAALATAPAHGPALELLSKACERSGDFAAEERALRRALTVEPKNVAVVARLALLLHAADREDEAGPYFRSVLELAPKHPTSHANYGIWLRTMGDLTAAEAQLRAGLQVAPNDAILHHALSHTLLSMGRMREGFEEAEWRHIPKRYAVPAWNGERDRERTVVMILGEGRGDVIQFLRYVPLAAERVRVVMETAPSLRRLMAGVPGIAAMFCPGEAAPEHDLYCSMMSLPRLLGLDEAALGMDVANPYLRANAGDVAHWGERVAALPGRKIGLVWAGAAHFSMDRRRSVPAALFDGLARADVTFVSLQKDAVSKPGLPLIDWTDELSDFADTAALIMNLDLVIAVDTAVAHLAGALGKPVWLLNRFDSDWRWLRQGEGSAWYPSLRQFRQPRLGDWRSVMQAVSSALG